MVKQSKKSFRQWRLGKCAACCLLSAAGCAPAPVAVHGYVTLDAQPLNEAVILFVPVEQGHKQTGGEIISGHYRIAGEDGLTPGKYRVEVADNPPISHARGSRRASSASARRVLPAKYAHESPLTAEVTRNGTTEFNFDLESATKNH